MEKDFDALVDAYEKPIYNLIYRILGDREDAADLTQETFVAAFRSFDEFRGESSIYTWLYRIAINKCKNKFKESGRRREYERMSLDGTPGADGIYEAIEVSAPDVDAPDALLQRKELKNRILQAITQLPADYRIVVVLRDIQGLSYQEVAEAAELSVDVVRTRLARARGMLRMKLGPYIGGS